ncbi:unnamed protein product [Alopecurus aequalis]
MKLRKVEPRGKAAAGIAGRARVLVTVTVLGSAGPLRFLVDEGESVTRLIRATLRCYAREGRMPLLGADAANFLLYTANALKADERISFNGCRSFMLWQKTVHQTVADDTGSELAATNSSPGRKGSSGWKFGLNKILLNFSFKV